MIIIKPMRHGLTVDCDCVCQNGIQLTPERCGEVCELTIAYLKGKQKPHHPMPAIRQCYCGYSLQQHKDMLPCDNLGLIQY